MSKSTSTPVAPKTASGARVRSWAVENGQPVKQTRGRLPKAVIEAFESATNEVYTPGEAKPRTTEVTLPVVKRNAKGARLKRPVEVTATEARRLAGAPAKGRLGSKHLLAAARAYEVEHFGSEQG